MKKKTVGVYAVLIALCLNGRVFAADGTWVKHENGTYSYMRENATQAKGTWEDIDGEWYHFDGNGIMETGWRTIGNFRYFFDVSGALTSGWQCDWENGGDWYYFDESGNPKIRWFYDGEYWYWFDSDGKMNRNEERIIDGETYFFRKNGSLKQNEYIGLSYIDENGQRESAYDILAEDNKGNDANLKEEEADELANKINALPVGWRKKFLDDGMRFVYCPSEDTNRTFQDKNGRSCSFHYCLNLSKKELKFSKTDDVIPGFGAYIFENCGDEMKRKQFPKMVRYHFAEISELFYLPDSLKREYPEMFAVLFTAFQTKKSWEKTEEMLPDVSWTVERIVKNRSEDGRLNLN